ESRSAPRFLPQRTATWLHRVQSFRRQQCRSPRFEAVPRPRPLETALVFGELAESPATPGCVKLEVKRPASLLRRRLRPFYSVFFDQSAKCSLLRGVKVEQFPAPTVKVEQ